jgi:hypothetical protein
MVVPGGAPSPLPADPVETAQRYRDLVAQLDGSRLRAIGDRAARARAHRVAARRIRARVDEAWGVIADPLAHYGYTDPQAMRPEGREADEVDPATAPAQAHDLCMRAVAGAAELRAVAGLGGPPPALVTGLASVLTGAAVVAARLLVSVPGLGAIAAAALAVALAVALASRGGYRAVVRGGLLGAGAAGIAVLVTARGHAHDPSGLIAAVVAVALAFRFGLGIGGRRAKT